MSRRTIAIISVAVALCVSVTFALKKVSPPIPAPATVVVQAPPTPPNLGPQVPRASDWNPDEVRAKITPSRIQAGPLATSGGADDAFAARMKQYMDQDRSRRSLPATPSTPGPVNVQ